MARPMTNGTARELNPGDHIGRYVVVRPLGRGGMGVVYVALNISGPPAASNIAKSGSDCDF